MSDIHMQKNETGPLYYTTDQKQTNKQTKSTKWNNQQNEKVTYGMWDNISDHISDKGLISKIVRNSYNPVAKTK